MASFALPAERPPGLPDVGKHTQMYIAIFSAMGNSVLRRAVRQVWKVPPQVTAKFVMCKYPGYPPYANATLDIGGKSWKNSREVRMVRSEKDMFQDIAFFDCIEGYQEGLLTKKILAVLREVSDKYERARWFFKTDDDTLPDLYSLKAAVDIPDSYIYGGLRQMPVPVFRDPSSDWYEPPWTYKEAKYPPTMPGGPGYVLSLPLIQHILSSGIPEANMLWNEDRAVAVWVQRADQAVRVTRVEVEGSEGFHYSKCRALNAVKQSDYKMVLLHCVQVDEMRCFDRMRDKPDADFGECFC